MSKTVRLVVSRRLALLMMFVVGTALILVVFPSLSVAQEKKQGKIDVEQSPAPASSDTDVVSTAATTAADACTDPTRTCLPDGNWGITYSDPTGVCTWNITMDWGDSSGSTTKTLPQGGSVTFSHTYVGTSFANPTFFTATATAPAGTSSDPDHWTCLPLNQTFDLEVPPSSVVIPAPETKIKSAPPSTSTSNKATFNYISPNYPPTRDPNNPGANLECRLDGSDWTPCGANGGGVQTYPCLPNGTHTFEVRAYITWQLNNDPPQKLADQTPATYTWQINAKNPKVCSVSPTNGATNVSLNTAVTATFSKDMDPNTLGPTTFKLTDAATGTAISATVSYDAATKKATLTPSQPLSASKRYKATVTTGAKDMSGNALDQKPKKGKQPMVWYFNTVSS